MRLAGQDSRRGTFTQRHSVLIDRNTGAEYTPLANLPDDQAQFLVYDSLLSRVRRDGLRVRLLGGQPGRAGAAGRRSSATSSTARRRSSTSSSPPARPSGASAPAVTLLLPHGYEGQGPDHSSGRLERFLQLCAENNMTVANCSTPANYFHLLRRQALSPCTGR